jgi:hypothetical protein
VPLDLKEAFSYIKGDRQQLAKYYAEDYIV